MWKKKRFDILKVRKKPVEVEAMRWTGDNLEEIKEFAGAFEWNIEKKGSTNSLLIHTLEGSMSAEKGDYIIKGVEGETYPVKPEIFNKTYEIIERD